MFIQQVCEMTGLTKKAVAYYEMQGLLCPCMMDNGYRSYGEREVAALREIALLRKLGIGIDDIKAVMASADKRAALAACKGRLARQASALERKRQCISRLMDNGYDIQDAAKYAARQLDENQVIRERLAQAFPGSYGQFLCFHFGPFLNGTIDSPEKEAAYGRILEFLDGLEDIPFPQEVEDVIADSGVKWDEDVTQALDSGTRAAIDHMDQFMREKKEIIRMYLDYIHSDAYKASPGYQIKRQLRAFQKASGYQELFIENMKILSDEYRAYYEKLMHANAQFLGEFPQAADLMADD